MSQDPWANYGQQVPQQAPQQFQQPQQGWQPYPQAPQQYTQPIPGAVPPPTPAPVAGTLDDFYNQPSSGGGPSVSWKDAQPGAQIVGSIARDVTNTDIRQQTDMRTNQPKFYRDGRPMLTMVVPLKVQPDQRFPEGTASLWVRGQLRDELTRAMHEAGRDGGPREGDLIAVTLTGRKPSGPGMSPANQFRVEYRRGDENAQNSAPATVPAQSEQSAPAPQPPTQQPPAPAQTRLTAEQQDLLARLRGQG